MTANQWLEQEFEANRGHLRGVAYRMLGSLAEAEDALQEAWLRLGRNERSGIENPAGWLTTVVARVCLDALRSRQSRREEALETEAGVERPVVAQTHPRDPEQEALLADSVGLAVLVVLEKLNPAERLAFVMHDMFGAPFDEIAEVLGRSPEAARQLASRARRRVQGTDTPSHSEAPEQREAVRRFMAALRSGDFEGLLAVLDPELVVRADAASAVGGVPREVRGAAEWARQAAGWAKGARFAQMALVDGELAVIVAPRGKLFRVVRFGFAEGRITGIEVVGEKQRLQTFDVALAD